MLEKPAKIGYDKEANVLYIGFNPTFSFDNKKVVSTDAKVLFTLNGDDINDIRIILNEKLDFLEKVGDDPAACSICASLEDFKQQLDTMFSSGNGEDNEKKEESYENVEPQSKDKFKLLMLLSLLAD